MRILTKKEYEEIKPYLKMIAGDSEWITYRNILTGEEVKVSQNYHNPF